TGESNRRCRRRILRNVKLAVPCPGKERSPLRVREGQDRAQRVPRMPDPYGSVAECNLYTLAVDGRCFALAPYTVSRFRVGHASPSLKSQSCGGGGAESRRADPGAPAKRDPNGSET